MAPDKSRASCDENFQSLITIKIFKILSVLGELSSNIGEISKKKQKPLMTQIMKRYFG
jgi:hypothetical protein